MTNQTRVNEALDIFEDMYREEVYVRREGRQVILEFDGYEFIVDLHNGNRWFNDTDSGVEIMAERETY